MKMIELQTQGIQLDSSIRAIIKLHPTICNHPIFCSLSIYWLLMSLAWRHRGPLSPWHICNEMSGTCHVSPSVMSVSRTRDRVLLPLPWPRASCPLIGQMLAILALIGSSHLSPRAGDWGLRARIEAWSCLADNILIHVMYARYNKWPRPD